MAIKTDELLGENHVCRSIRRWWWWWKVCVCGGWTTLHSSTHYACAVIFFSVVFSQEAGIRGEGAGGSCVPVSGGWRKWSLSLASSSLLMVKERIGVCCQASASPASLVLIVITYSWRRRPASYRLFPSFTSSTAFLQVPANKQAPSPPQREGLPQSVSL